MFNWLKSKDEAEVYNVYDVIDGLKEVYKTKLLPMEKEYKFQDFHSPLLRFVSDIYRNSILFLKKHFSVVFNSDADFLAKPMVMLVGQYSTGKTTFIRHLLERDFPGMHIGM